MSRYFTRGAQIFVDIFAMSLAFWISFLLRFEFDLTLEAYKLLFFTWPYVVLFQYLMLVIFGVPRMSWRYVGISEASSIFMSITVATGVLVVLRLGLAPLGGYFKFVSIPLGVLGMHFVLSFLGITGVRVIRRSMTENRERNNRKASPVRSKKTLLIGAGRAGVMVSREVIQNPHLSIQIVGFIDDDKRKLGTIIQGHKVLGTSAQLKEVVDSFEVEQAIITIAAASGESIRRIVNLCKEIDLKVKIIPGIYEILDGRVNLSRIREVTIEDLLGRDAVDLDLDAIGHFISGKRVVITGAGGSIGSELCRQVMRFGPQKLLLLEQAENALFTIHSELAARDHQKVVFPCIADICDATRVEMLFARFMPQIVFHAAAHKHVPMMEWNPGEAIKNNVFGTRTVADAADKFHAEAFVQISTDKAVNPTSIMGASKRVAEIYLQALARQSQTKFVAVRFGNVLGSAGSVIPLFKEQIRQGGPVTVTHPEMKRYFMTIPEACQLVMQAASMGQGGEIFVLDMGEPVKIVDLAKDLIRLSGFSESEIPIEFSGIRPGEKLFEELSTAGEDMTKTRHPKIFIGKIETYPIKKVNSGLAALASITNSADEQDVRLVLESVIPEMRQPDSEPPLPRLVDSVESRPSPTVLN